MVGGGERWERHIKPIWAYDFSTAPTSSSMSSASTHTPSITTVSDYFPNTSCFCLPHGLQKTVYLCLGSIELYLGTSSNVKSSMKMSLTPQASSSFLLLCAPVWVNRNVSGPLSVSPTRLQTFWGQESYLFILVITSLFSWLQCLTMNVKPREGAT